MKKFIIKVLDWILETIEEWFIPIVATVAIIAVAILIAQFLMFIDMNIKSDNPNFPVTRYDLSNQMTEETQSLAIDIENMDKKIDKLISEFKNHAMTANPQPSYE